MARARRTRSRYLSPTYYLRRSALRKGVFGGQTGWLAVGAFVWGPRLAKKAFGKNEVVVANEVLNPGQRMELITIPPPTRSERKAARKAS